MDNTQMKEICKSLYFLSDLQEQKRLWIDLNSNNEISSFDEEIQYLYYNLQFANFILENKHFWDKSFFDKIIIFSKSLYSFWDEVIQKYPDDKKIHHFLLFDSSKWRDLSNESKEIYLVISQLLGN